MQRLSSELPSESLKPLSAPCALMIRAYVLKHSWHKANEAKPTETRVGSVASLHGNNTKMFMKAVAKACMACFAPRGQGAQGAKEPKDQGGQGAKRPRDARHGGSWWNVKQATDPRQRPGGMAKLRQQLSSAKYEKRCLQGEITAIGWLADPACRTQLPQPSHASVGARRSHEAACASQLALQRAREREEAERESEARRRSQKGQLSGGRGGWAGPCVLGQDDCLYRISHKCCCQYADLVFRGLRWLQGMLHAKFKNF